MVGVSQSAWGGRHHFLRWQTPTSFRLWDDAGLSYDSTLGFAEAPGFRCGVCHPFRTFDLAARRELNLVERPLIVMDASLQRHQYMGLSARKALDVILELRRATERMSGEFVILWHNNVLTDPIEQDLYRAALTGRA